MKSFIATLGLSFGLALTSFGQAAKHVVLISIDGFRPDFYREAKWPTPNLQRMAAQGTSADGVRGVFPSVTYPSHTTLITGVAPAQHGIYYNSPFEPDGATGRWYWEENLIKTETLWDAVHKAGLKSASVMWPVSVGAPIDYNVPEYWSLDKNMDRFTPVREQTVPKGLMEEIETNATGKLTARDMSSDYVSGDENGSRIAAYLMSTYKPALLTLHVFGVDHAEHQDGRDGEHVRRALATADWVVGNIVEALTKAGIEKETAVIVTGDHGFVDITTTLAPNVWLAQNGLYGANKGDWKAQFHTSGAAAFLMLKTKNDKKTLEQVRRLLAAAPAEQRKLFRVVERAELDQIGADPNVALALAPVPGVSMNGSREGEVVRPGKGGTHGFFPDFGQIQTGFIGFGPGFAAGQVVPQMALQDVAPITARLLGLPFTGGSQSPVPAQVVKR
ncbi:ectonucleotide pyrophosphatase/phosphodiesterase [Hymenobacter tibetensis]|uniref:Ectonucleotide pyrophosphatase/phosphodiesterase n=1 Tax=Hymenobacter tibetensis TaxID=497967 RepID=A0ABY4CXC5_9BACT|nr:ectonucleotide pyrophosphatase/phosphodiesterase [Hymenobacter tibetensis]UOG74929.1 ectonucleotide pyrophosphatase/phosphodiesterase [Hymenobacter tibetensis]